MCDVEDRAAVARLYAIKEVANPLTKPLSLLCRGLDDVAKYTQGLPGGGGPGAPNLFRIANAVLPGPYTLLLPASKALPKNCVLDKRGAPVCKLRRTVGVRLPAHPVTAALLARLSRPLLCTSVDWAVDTQAGTQARNAAKLDFVVAVDALHRDEAPGVPLPSTVIDLSTGMPRLLRQGAGDWCVQPPPPSSCAPSLTRLLAPGSRGMWTAPRTALPSRLTPPKTTTRTKTKTRTHDSARQASKLTERTCTHTL